MGAAKRHEMEASAAAPVCAEGGPVGLHAGGDERRADDAGGARLGVAARGMRALPCRRDLAPMDTRLARLIADYQAHVAKAVALLERAGLSRPKSNVEWALQRTLPSPDLGDGFVCRKHGYGCFVRGPAWAVDFDFGDVGQIDGFDAWRLQGW